MATRRGNLPGCNHDWTYSHDSSINRDIRRCNRCGQSEVVPRRAEPMPLPGVRLPPPAPVTNEQAIRRDVAANWLRGEHLGERINQLEGKIEKLLLIIRQAGVADAVPEFEELWRELSEKGKSDD